MKNNAFKQAIKYAIEYCDEYGADEYYDDFKEALFLLENEKSVNYEILLSHMQSEAISRMPAKPISIQAEGLILIDYCPNCNGQLIVFKQNNCMYCGMPIDWEE